MNTWRDTKSVSAFAWIKWNVTEREKQDKLIKFLSLLKSLLVYVQRCLIRNDSKKKLPCERPFLCMQKVQINMPTMIRSPMVSLHFSNRSNSPKHKSIVSGAVPAYLLDRENVSRAKILSNTVKQKRKEKAGKWTVPIPKVKPIADDEMFKQMQSGKRQKKNWKRMITKVTFVGDAYTRKAPKFERFIRPTGLRFKKAHITHPELKTTFCLDILGVKKNPSSSLYTNLGVITKGTIIEVNVSELGLVTQSGKVVWGKYAQVTNNPELDGCINGVLLV